MILLMLLAVTEPPLPHLVGHRGLPYHAPEDTLAGYGAALDLRLGIEIDARRTRDGKLVSVHDADVARTTDGKGKVDSLTLAELKRLDAGGWFDPAYAGERIPTVEEVFALVKQRRAMDALLLVDLKDPDTEAELVKLAVRSGLLSQVVFLGRTNADPQVRRKLRAAHPKAQVTVAAETAADLAAALEAPDADWILLRYLPTPDDVARIHRAGKRALLAGKMVFAYDPNVCRGAVEAHLDAVLTDFPLECRALGRSLRPRR